MNISGKNREERNPPSPLCPSYQQKQDELSLQNTQGSASTLQPVLGAELRTCMGAGAGAVFTAPQRAKGTPAARAALAGSEVEQGPVFSGLPFQVLVRPLWPSLCRCSGWCSPWVFRPVPTLPVPSVAHPAATWPLFEMTLRFREREALCARLQLSTAAPHLPAAPTGTSSSPDPLCDLGTLPNLSGLSFPTCKATFIGANEGPSFPEGQREGAWPLRALLPEACGEGLFLSLLKGGQGDAGCRPAMPVLLITALEQGGPSQPGQA